MNNSINPQAMLQMMSAFATLKSNHPKMVNFVEKFLKNGLPEDSIIEITVKEPGKEPVTANMKVSASDLEAIKGLKNMQG